MMDALYIPLAIQPIVSYPQEAQLGKTYLMTIDLRHSGYGNEWPYREEEYTIYCLVDTAPLFHSKPVGEPAVILHRFGGTYGPASFYLTAHQETTQGSMRITLVNEWGMPINVFELDNISVRAEIQYELRELAQQTALDRTNQSGPEQSELNQGGMPQSSHQVDVKTAIYDLLRATFPVGEPRVQRFYAMQEYQLGWRDEQLEPASIDMGRLLRPQLVLLACRAAGGEPQRAVPLAAGIQLIHEFSLLHDDIMDNSDTRRGRPTVWKLWGLAQGINAGDGMFAVAHQVVHRLSETGISPAVVLEVLKHLDQTMLTLLEGQFLDLSYEGNLAISEDDYFVMISRKTAALISAATGLGAIIGGADTTTVKAMFDFGENLALAFQLQDDILGIWGDSMVTGKPVAADLYRRKVSLPIIHALHTADQRDRLAELYSQQETSDNDLQEMLDILAQAGSQGYTQNLVAFYRQLATDSLEMAHRDNEDTVIELRTLASRLLG
jgi:geranylgeranyl diphosphate synthase, type I